MIVPSITSGSRHHFFGFHDLVQSNAKGDLILALEVEDITHPPLPGESAQSGVVERATKNFIPIHQTEAFNYPQGARQQWVGDSDYFLCNGRKEGLIVCHVSDARTQCVEDVLPFPVHCHNPKTCDAFYMNYDRLHRVGGYGYHGGCDCYANQDIPEQDGIFKGNIKTKKNELLVSLRQIASCAEKRPVVTGFPHYVTHFVLNPSRTRLAFLHRFRVQDGGEITRLMTIDTNGNNMRCLAKGFLSHFDWLDDQQIFMWGRDERKLCQFREARWLRIPGLLHGAVLAKKIIRGLRSSGKTIQGLPGQNNSFLRIQDDESSKIEKIGSDVLLEDGHPMLNPVKRDILVIDTYPNASGIRTLMLYNWKVNTRVDLGIFQKLEQRPDVRKFNAQSIFKGIDKRIRKKFADSKYLFTRSGLHCDLHPRWSADGKCVFFDSIHEGTRQIYEMDCECAMKSLDVQ